MRILVAEPLAEEGLALLDKAEVDYEPKLARADLLARLPGAHALIVRSGVKVDARRLPRAPNWWLSGGRAPASTTST